MKISLTIFHFVLIFYCVYSLGRKWGITNSKLFWSAFLFRLAAGISLGLIYTYYYSANDTWLLFEDARKFSALAREDFFSYAKALLDFSDDQILPGLAYEDWRAVFFVRIISVLCFLSFDNYWVCAAYFSLFGFIASWKFHCKVTSVFPDSFAPSALAFLFFPSVVFWSSGVEKESLALCVIYFLSIVFLTAISGKRPPVLVLTLIVPACLLLWNLKYYWAIVFFISSLSAIAMRTLMLKFLWIKNYTIALWAVLFFGIGLGLSFTHPNFYLYRFLEVIVSNHNEFVAISDSKNLIHYYQLDQTWASIIINSPWALISGLFRPVIGEGQRLLGWVASIENFFLVVLFIGAVMNFKKAFTSSYQIILLTALSYCAVLCVFLALSTPNFGTLSRYRIGFLPFFVFIITYKNPIVNWILNRFGSKRV